MFDIFICKHMHVVCWDNVSACQAKTLSSCVRFPQIPRWNPRYIHLLPPSLRPWYLSPGLNSARLWPWTTWSLSTMKWATCSIFCSTKTSRCPSVMEPTLASTRPLVMCWPFLCPHQNISRASASWRKWKTTLVCDFLCMHRARHSLNSKDVSVAVPYSREWYQLLAEHGTRQDCFPPFWLLDGPVEMEGVWWTYLIIRVQ